MSGFGGGSRACKGPKMGKRGPAPKPRHLKMVEGTKRDDREADNPPEPTGLPDRPDFADELAGEKWDELFPVLDRMGILTEADGEALARLCEWHAVYERACSTLASYGSDLTFTTENGYEAQRAEFGIMAKAWDKLGGLYTRFGLDPSSRSGVSVVDRDGKDRPLQKYVGGK